MPFGICSVCGSVDDLQYYDGLILCSDCIEDYKRLVEEDEEEN